MPAASQAIEPISKQLTIFIGLTVVGFMAFGLTLSFYRNILFDRTLTAMEEENTRIAAEIDKGYRDVDYYRSEQYKDKYAKENLGKVNPGEKVLIITQNLDVEPANEEEAISQSEHREAAYLELLRQMPVKDHWNLYLFHPERIEELKREI